MISVIVACTPVKGPSTTMTESPTAKSTTSTFLFRVAAAPAWAAFTFITKTPPAAELIKKAAGLSSGSANPLKDKVGKVTKDQVREIATTKLPDLNANDIDAAMKIIEGTARSMGVTVD